VNCLSGALGVPFARDVSPAETTRDLPLSAELFNVYGPLRLVEMQVLPSHPFIILAGPK
jgi:hypothetical protein